MAGALESLIQIFAERPMVVSREMRLLLERDRKDFLADALLQLQSEHLSPGQEYVLTLLGAQDLLIPRLCDPDLPLADAIRLAKRIAAKTDPLIDVKLARCLLPANGAKAAVVGRGAVLRVLEIIDAISDGARMITLLTQILRHEDAHVRSKAALLVGRVNRNLAWVQQRMAEPDPRVRANAVESLWGVDSPPVRQLFLAAAKDPDGRVAGNGLLGLYQLGDLAAAELLAPMLASPDPKIRATAAWVMGQTDDPRFLPALLPCNTASDDCAGRNIAAAIARLEQQVQRAAQSSPLKVTITTVDTLESSRRITVAVVNAACRPLCGLKPRMFVIENGGQVILNQTIQPREHPEQLGIVFLLPRDAGTDGGFLVEAMRAFLGHKTPADSWAVVRYCEPAGQAEGAAEKPPGNPIDVRSSIDVRFSTDPRWLLNATAAGVAADVEMAGAYDTVRALLPDMSLIPASRHIIFLGPPPAAAWTELRGAARESLTAIHAMTLAEGDPGFRQLCAHSGGSCFVFDPRTEGLPALVESVIARLYNLYTIAFECQDTGSVPITLRIYADHAFGEHTIVPPADAADAVVSASEELRAAALSALK